MDYMANYDVTQCGNVLRLRDGLRLKGQVSRIGYHEVKLSNKGKSRMVGIHRLVAEAFIPNPDNLPQVNHKDGDKLNNDASNLEWCAHADNVKHAVLTGLRTSLIPNLKADIERLKTDGLTQRAISKELGVSEGMVSMVLSGKRRICGI